MHLRPSLLQHGFEVKLSLAESPCSAVEETKAWGGPGPAEGQRAAITKPASTASRALCAKELPHSASEEVHHAENRSIPNAAEVFKDGSKPSGLFLPLTFLDALHIQSMPTDTKVLCVLKH